MPGGLARLQLGGVACMCLALLGMGCTVPYPIQVLPVASKDHSPSVGPSGGSYVFAHFDAQPGDTLSPSGVYVADSAGGRPRLLVPGGLLNPEWGHGDSVLAWGWHEGVVLLSTSSGVVTPLGIAHGQFPSWSPNGDSLVFNTEGGDSVAYARLGLASVSDGGVRFIPHTDGGAWLMPNWSPDGESLVFVKFIAGSLGGEIVVYELGTGAQTRITNNDLEDYYPAWSPDGASLVWSRVHVGGTEDIWAWRLADRIERRVTLGHRPRWSPDGRAIVFDRVDGKGGAHIYKRDLQTGSELQLPGAVGK